MGPEVSKYLVMYTLMKFTGLFRDNSLSGTWMGHLRNCHSRCGPSRTSMCSYEFIADMKHKHTVTIILAFTELTCSIFYILN